MIEAQRFLEKISLGDGCWEWTAAVNGEGYGQFRLDNHGRQVPAHRYAYELLVGPIPEGLEIDHLCRVRRCVRPNHLEPVTTRINCWRGFGFTGVNARKQTCPRAHTYDRVNIRGDRFCSICSTEQNRRYREAKRCA